MYTLRVTSTIIGILMILALMAFVFWTQGQSALASTTDEQVRLMGDALDFSAETMS